MAFLLAFKDSSADFVFRSDGWNDFGYLTGFDVLAGPAITHKKSLSRIGFIRFGIWGSPIHAEFVRLIPEGKFTQIPGEFFSWSFDVEFFENLAIYLNKTERENLLKQLNFGLPDSPLFENIRRETCYKCAQHRPDTLSDLSILINSVPEMTEYMKNCHTLIKHFMEDDLIHNSWSVVTSINLSANE